MDTNMTFAQHCRQAIELSSGLRVRGWSKASDNLRATLCHNRNAILSASVKMDGDGRSHQQPGERQGRASLREEHYVPTTEQTRQAVQEPRPHLRPRIRNLEDDKLLALINWSSLEAWQRAKASMEAGGRP